MGTWSRKYGGSTGSFSRENVIPEAFFALNPSAHPYDAALDCTGFLSADLVCGRPPNRLLGSLQPGKVVP